jgi:diguanylate cyclase (GGDEF)-like protein/PAS domain S-box-containing protein
VTSDRPGVVAVLLVEDDEDDALLTRAFLRDVPTTRYEVDWARTMEEVRALRAERTHDVYLVDYRLGAHTGLDVAREILGDDRHLPVIMLTGDFNYEVDLQAGEIGIVDFLVKGEIDSGSLDRSIRYGVAHQQALAALAESEERYALAMAGANDGIWDWDLRSGRLYVSPRWQAMLGYSAGAIGESPDEWLGRIHPADRARVQHALDAHLAGRTPHFESEHRVRAGDGLYRWMLARGLAVRGVDGRPTRVAGSQTDITERKRTESQLKHDALHDALTGLPNRVLFMNRLEHAMRRNARRGATELTAVLFLDLDRFKLVNDSLGHVSGDRLLVEVAARLDAALRPGDTVARLGGDEFTVLLEDLTEREEAERVAERMLDTLTAPFRLDDRDLYLSASIGIAVAPPEADPGEVVRDADAAMYRAKAEGKGRHAMFDATLHAAAVARLDVETRLRRGLSRGVLDGEGLAVVYQPIVRGADGEITGFEALARWAEADGTRLNPDQFIPVAEETGLIHTLGRLVLREACRQIAIWRRHRPQLTMAVNISRRQLLDQGFGAEVRAALTDHDLPAHALRLEITETEAAADPMAVRRALESIYALVGVRAHLDDFGTGSSSLTFLRGFPGDVLKIDRSFVLAMPADEGAFQIVQAITGLAHNLGMQIVAEGVEEEAQAEMLRALGCEFQQGFLHGRPMPARDAELAMHPALRSRV